MSRAELDPAATSRRRALVVYAALPATVGLGLVAGYFSGVPVLMEIVAPRANRELGLVENLQHGTLVGMIALCARAAWRDSGRVARGAWLAVALLSAFVLLEELDYGMHYAELLVERPQDLPIPENLHNRGDNNRRIKWLVDTTIAVVFVVLPWVAMRWPPPIGRDWLPSRYAPLTAIAALAVGELAHALDRADLPDNGALDGNISEFRETFVYYLAWLYLTELWSRRRSRAVNRAAS